MKASITFPALVLSLLLCTAVWAQDEDTTETATAEVIEEASAELVDAAESEDSVEPVEPAEMADSAESDDPAESVDSAEPVDSADHDEAAAQAVTDEADEEVTDTDEGDTPAESDALVDDDSSDNAPEAIETEPAEADTQVSPEVPAEQTTLSEVPPGTDIFVFQGHPIFTSDQAELVYRPLVNYLNDTLPYRFELEIARDFHRYWLSTRRGEHPHLVLEEPHLTAFRIERHGFTPLVRAADPLSYSLLTTVTAEAGESSVRDFIARPVSTMPAPSLGYLILASWFDNPMQQPIIQSSASSWLDAVEIVFSNEAHAAMVPNNLVERYVNMENVLTSREFPGLTIAASPAVPVDIQEEIRDALLALHEDEGHYAALHELDIDRFEPARRSEYLGLDSWLDLVYANY